MSVGSWLPPSTAGGTVAPAARAVPRVIAADPGAFLDGEPWTFTVTFQDPVTGNPTDLTGSRLYVDLSYASGFALTPIQVLDSAANDGSVSIAPGTGGQATFTAAPQGRSWTAPFLGQSLIALPALVYGDVYRQVNGGAPVGLTRLTLRVLPSTGAPYGTPTPSLSVLTLSTTTATAGSPFSATIGNRTPGSTLTATASDGTVLGVSGSTLSGTFATAGSVAVTLTETLAGAVGSPRVTVVTVTVSGASSGGGTLDFSDPNNSGLLAALCIGVASSGPVTPTAGTLNFSDANNSGLIAATGA